MGELHGMICWTIELSYARVYSTEAVRFFKEYHSIEHIRSDASVGHTILALENDSIIGTGTLLGHNIRRVFVRPDRQGKGIGGRIMTRLERMASDDRVEMVDLDSSMVSVEFYHRRGYLGDERCFLELGNGTKLGYIPMTKNIRPGLSP